MNEYIGQDRIRENLLVSIEAARQRGEALDHVLLYGPPGLGKTTLAHVIGNELGVPVRSTAGPVLEKPGDLAAILTNLKAREVLFIDEIHSMSPAIEEILYPALEDYELDLVIGQGPGARSVKVPLQPFTLVGATTRDRAPHRAAAQPLRHRPSPRLLRPVGHGRDRRAGRRGSSASRSTMPRRSSCRGGLAARRASPTGCCAGSATTPRCAPTAPSP